MTASPRNFPGQAAASRGLQKDTTCATLLAMTQGEAQAVDPLVGSLVANKYRIVRQLGEGGMGCVYLAEQQLGSTARKVALKTLHKHLSHDPHIKARFDREAGTVAALEHPNTIQVYDFGSMDDGTLYLVMEFVQGRSVADILEKDGAMAPARVENIFKQVCGSLEEAHSHGIVHRDLKPDNVVLCEKAGVKDWVEVLDFGIAKRSSEHDPNEAKLTQQGMVLGTPPYMSPEQFTGQPVDVRSDIYALGIMAYEMLTGRFPFEANTAWEWASKHMTEAPRPIDTQPLGPNVPETMRNAIHRALAKNKDERFATVREFFDAFSATGAHIATATAAQAAMPAPGVPSSPDHGAAAGGGGRAKTEMAQPVMGGGPPPYDGGGMGGGHAGMGGPMPGSSPSPAVSVPQGPPHVGAHGGGGQKSSNTLVIALAAVAVLLIGGGVTAYAVGGKPKPVPTTLTDLNGTSTAVTTSTTTSASGHVEEPAASVATAEPLGGASAKPLTPTTPVNPQGGGTKPTTPTTPKTVPTPSIKPADPPKTRPAVCDSAKAAMQRGSPAAAGLEAKCRAAGFTP